MHEVRLPRIFLSPAAPLLPPHPAPSSQSVVPHYLWTPAAQGFKEARITNLGSITEQNNHPSFTVPICFLTTTKRSFLFPISFLWKLKDYLLHKLISLRRQLSLKDMTCPWVGVVNDRSTMNTKGPSTQSSRHPDSQSGIPSTSTHWQPKLSQPSLRTNPGEEPLPTPHTLFVLPTVPPGGAGFQLTCTSGTQSSSELDTPGSHHHFQTIALCENPPCFPISLF